MITDYGACRQVWSLHDTAPAETQRMKCGWTYVPIDELAELARFLEYCSQKTENPSRAIGKMRLLFISLMFALWSVSCAHSQSNDLLLFSDSNPDEDLFFENSDPPLSEVVVASTDCAATQQSSTDEGFSLLSRNHADSCDLPLPLSTDTLQLFQEPLDSLEEILSPNDDDAPRNTYPGLLSTEEQLEKERNPNACEQYLLLGYIYRLCCEVVDAGIFPEYRSVSSCRLEPGTPCAWFRPTILFPWKSPRLQ